MRLGLLSVTFLPWYSESAIRLVLFLCSIYASRKNSQVPWRVIHRVPIFVINIFTITFTGATFPHHPASSCVSHSPTLFLLRSALVVLILFCVVSFAHNFFQQCVGKFIFSVTPFCRTSNGMCTCARLLQLHTAHPLRTPSYFVTLSPSTEATVSTKFEQAVQPSISWFLGQAAQIPDLRSASSCSTYPLPLCIQVPTTRKKFLTSEI